MTERPIACSLSADDMTERRSLIDALVADGLLGRTATPAGAVVRLRGTPDIERRVRELIALESVCCPFLDFDLGRDGGALALTVSGPQDARALIDGFLAVG